MTGSKGRLAVVGRGGTLTAALLGQLTGMTVEELTPCGAAIADGREPYRALIVENFDPAPAGVFTPCAAARWALAGRAEVTVVGLDDGQGRRLAAQRDRRIFSYSDGRPEAGLTAKNVSLRGEKLEFDALTDRELLRLRVPLTGGPRLYDYLAALAGALALGIPLEGAAAQLNRL